MIAKETPTLHCFILSKEFDWHFAVSHGHLPTHLWGIIVVYCNILSEYHLLRTKSGWNIRKKGWNADAWVAEDGRPHGTTWRVIGWWPFLTSLFLPSLFGNTGASSRNRNTQSPLEQWDLDSKEIFQTEEMAQRVTCLPCQYEDLNSEPQHTYQKTLCTGHPQTQLWKMQRQADQEHLLGDPSSQISDSIFRFSERSCLRQHGTSWLTWPLTSTPGFHRCLALPYTYTCIHIHAKYS